MSVERVLAPQIARTETCLGEHPGVLCMRDTTVLDCATEEGIAGLGPLNDATRWGMYLHPALAVTPDCVSLGLLELYGWARELGSLGHQEGRNRPLDEKGSVRWVDGQCRVNVLAEQLSETRLTSIADREGDIYDLFVQAPLSRAGRGLAGSV